MVFDGSHVEFMPEMAWFMGVWELLRDIGSLRVKSSKDMWQLVLESNKHGIGQSFFSSVKRDIFGKGCTVIESFADYMPAFVHPP